MAFYFRNDGKKDDFEFCRRWEKQLAEKQKELESMYVTKPVVILDPYKYSFFIRIVKESNNLVPQFVVEAESFNLKQG